MHAQHFGCSSVTAGGLSLQADVLRSVQPLPALRAALATLLHCTVLLVISDKKYRTNAVLTEHVPAFSRMHVLLRLRRSASAQTPMQCSTMLTGR
jgi:hypothetical protein